MIVLVLWYLKEGVFNVFKRKDSYLFLSFFFLSLFSVILGTVLIYGKYNQVVFFRDNLQVLVITWFAFLFLHYFCYQFTNYKFKINIILIAYILFAFSFAILFWSNPQLYFDVRRFWTLGNERIVFTNYSSQRFCYISSEPNNFSVVVLGIMLYFRFVKKIKFNIFLILSIISLFLVVTSMSTTGIILYIFYFFISVVFVDFKNLNYKKILLPFGFLLLLLLLGALHFNFILSIINSDIVQTAFGRYGVYYETENYTGSRVDIWLRLLQEINIFKYILIGQGTSIYSNGVFYKPHNGHLFLIYGYGMIAYLIFLYEFFIPRKSITKLHYFIIVIPFLIIFTMNTFIGDLRSFYIYIILLASIININSNIVNVEEVVDERISECDYSSL